jgi:AraC-like DNA-binding protein
MGLPETAADLNEAVPLAFARALLYTAQERGVDVAGLLAESSFPFNPLLPPVQSPFISMEQYSRLCIALFRSLDDETGGIMPGEPTRFGTTRLLLFAVIRCKSLEDVLERAFEFNRCCRERSRLRSAWLDVDAENGLATLSYQADYQAAENDASHAGALCGTAMWLRLCSWLIGQPIDILAASCAGAESSNPGALRHFLHCPVTFRAAQHSVTFKARLLQAPVVRNERDLERFLSVAPYHLVIKPAVSDTSVSARIQELLQRDLLEPPDFEALTGMLNMSARTLRRRLEKEGTSYQRIKDNTRRDAAISLLCRTRLPIAEIAARVGFSDPSAFHRSFKKWTVLAPEEYR